ncbi:hypothetical protein CBR_g34256 [Chara braunii]|uniref:Uncharacterized protein n=1 Tax=Chara braunii TaxID=69332 RepID=A0A388JYJ7_CHABU|nr:hypothetical protein CBR_g34256 [Chara braunii]|eukprot:GBG62884.1 hypothetical protein CBR_g34256 [Chara braunii]
MKVGFKHWECRPCADICECDRLRADVGDPSCVTFCCEDHEVGVLHEVFNDLDCVLLFLFGNLRAHRFVKLIIESRTLMRHDFVAWVNCGHVCSLSA